MKNRNQSKNSEESEEQRMQDEEEEFGEKNTRKNDLRQSSEQ